MGFWCFGLFAASCLRLCHPPPGLAQPLGKLGDGIPTRLSDRALLCSGGPLLVGGATPPVTPHNTALPLTTGTGLARRPMAGRVSPLHKAPA
jgi:hypothetical protein